MKMADNPYINVATGSGTASPLAVILEQLRSEISRSEAIQAELTARLTPVLVPIVKDESDNDVCNPRRDPAGPLIEDLESFIRRLGVANDWYIRTIDKLQL
jgi:hypothetical protein